MLFMQGKTAEEKSAWLMNAIRALAVIFLDCKIFRIPFDIAKCRLSTHDTLIDVCALL